MKYLFIGLFVLVMSCGVNRTIRKEKYTIPYILQANVEELLAKEISRTGKKVYFLLRHIKGDTFHIVPVELSEPYLFASLTNRKVLIGKRLYPLVLDFDISFAAYETGDSILSRAKRQKYLTYTRQFNLLHGLYRVVFIQRGEVISQGYDKI